MRIIFFIACFGFSTAVTADDRVSRYLGLMEGSFNTSRLLYTRIRPEISAKVKAVDIPEQAVVVAKCVVGKAKSEGLLSEFDSNIELNENFVKYIRETPSLTLLTLVDDVRFSTLQNEMLSPKFSRFQVHSEECGAIDMNMKLMKESGLFEAMNSVRQQ